MLVPGMLGVVVVTLVLGVTSGGIEDADAGPARDFGSHAAALFQSEPGLCEMYSESFMLAPPLVHGYTGNRPVSPVELEGVLARHGFIAGDFEHVEYGSDRIFVASWDALSVPAFNERVVTPRAVQVELGLVAGAAGGPRWVEFAMTAIVPCPGSPAE